MTGFFAQGVSFWRQGISLFMEKICDNDMLIFLRRWRGVGKVFWDEQKLYMKQKKRYHSFMMKRMSLLGEASR